MTKVDIIDYLGKHEEGIIVSIVVGIGDEYYDATFFYRETLLALNVEEELEKKIGCKIEDWEHYSELMLQIINKVVPYEEMIGRIDDFDPSKYDLYRDDES